MLTTFLLLFSFISCSDSSTDATAQQAQETSSSEEAKTKPAEPQQRIVSLGGSVTETIFALGEGDRVVAVDASSLYPEDVLKLPKVGYYRQISTEGILSAKPSIVIASDASGPKESIEQIAKIGVPITQVSSEKTLAGTEKRIQQIASLLNKKKEGEKIIAQIREDLKLVQKPEKSPKVLFIYARGIGTLSVGGKNTASSEMITLAGGTNAVQEYEGYKPLNAESIIIAAPDYILLTTRGLDSLGTIDDLLKLKGISETPAAKNKRIISMDDLMLLGFGPRTGKAAAELSKLLQK
ncbi:MAG: hemin ABC transporter substrate-binding protein [Deltaproteobacteria bacterium]|nr:hemin ABC transporter substrate-binding protein [Deltaproteobacteria bacterium]